MYLQYFMFFLTNKHHRTRDPYPMRSTQCRTDDRNGELEARDQSAAQRRGRDLAGVDWGVSRQQTHGESGDDATQQHHRHVDGLSKTMQLETPSAQNLAGAG